MSQQGQPTPWPPRQPQQPPQWQHPQQNTHYPPQWQPRSPYQQQPHYQPMPQYPLPYQQHYYAPPPPPPKKSRAWLWALLAVAIALCATYSLLGSAGTSQNTTASTTTTSGVQPTDTPVPTQGTWTVTHIYKGTGEKKTETFTVGDDWKIDYTCTEYNDESGIDGTLTVEVYHSDYSSIDLAVNKICRAGKKTTGETEEHQGGSVYLEIESEGEWKVQVQELK